MLIIIIYICAFCTPRRLQNINNSFTSRILRIMIPSKDSILLELLEVLFNSILFLREVYPSEIFVKRSYYRLPLNISVFPPLNDYIENILKIIQELLSSGQLQKAELVIYEDMDQVLESYVFDVLNFHIPEE